MRFHAKEAERRAMLRLSVRIFRRTGAKPGPPAARRPANLRGGSMVRRTRHSSGKGGGNRKIFPPLADPFVTIRGKFYDAGKNRGGIFFFSRGK